MWEKIKKFFKWIADHTGISWIARKISSGWKWLFGDKANATQENTSQQKKPSGNERQEQSKGTITLETPDDKVNSDQSIPPAAPDGPQGPVINLPKANATKQTENPIIPNLENADSDVLKEAPSESYLKVDGKDLLLVLTSEQLAKCKEYKNTQGTGLELLMYIKCNGSEYRIVGNSTNEGSILIKSILKKNESGKYIDGNIVRIEEGIKHVKKMLELNNDGVVKVDSISNRASEAPTLEQPNSNDNISNQQSAGPGGLFQSNDKEPQPTTPNQLVNQDNIAGQDSSKIGETQNSPTTDLTTEQSTSGDGISPEGPNDGIDKEVENLVVDLVDKVSAQDSGQIVNPSIDAPVNRKALH